MTVQQDYRTELKSHGSRQLELKSHFPLSGNRTDRYRLDTWIYIPATLGISEKNYTVDFFFSGIRSLTRFSAAYIPLSDLIDPHCSISPLVRLEQELSATAAVAGRQEQRRKQVLYELRSLAGIYGADSSAMERTLVSALSEGQLPIIKQTIKANLKEIEAFLGRWRRLYRYFLKPDVPQILKDAYKWTDDSVGLTTDRYLYRLYSSLEQDEESKPLLKRIRNLIDEEHEYRRKLGYTVLEEDAKADEIEQRVYHENILKKWAQSVLYLDHEESATRRNMNHLLAAFAAATAMGFAVAATLLVERYFPGRSILWAVGVIVAYMFKDRIKESFRNILIHTLPSLVSDRRIRLTDKASGKRIGTAGSRVRFLKALSAPPGIAAIRRKDQEVLQDLLPEEDLIHFMREITIRSRILRRYHTRLTDLTDIVRLNLDELFRRMDDPEKTIATFTDGRPTEFPGHRIYPVNLVLTLTRTGSREQYDFHYRVVLDRNGLKRIEKI